MNDTLSLVLGGGFFAALVAFRLWAGIVYMREFDALPAEDRARLMRQRAHYLY